MECLWELCELSLFLTLDSLTITFSFLLVSCSNVIGKISNGTSVYILSLSGLQSGHDILCHLNGEMEVGEMLLDTKMDYIKGMV